MASSSKVFTDPAQLPPEVAARHYRAESLIDAWRGGAAPAIESAALTESVLREYPNFLPARVEAARARMIRDYALTGRDDAGLEAARDILLKAIALDPAYPKAHVLLGHVYINMRDFKGARRELTEAERLGTTNPWLHANWADLLVRTGQPKKAILRCIKVLESGTQNAKVLSATTGMLISLLGGSSARGVDYPQLVARLPMSTQQLHALGKRLLSAEHPDRSSLQLSKAIADFLVLKNIQDASAVLLQADYQRVSGYLGPSLELRDVYRQGTIENAEMVYYQAVRLAPRAPEGYAGMARLTLDAGRVADAKILLDGLSERNIHSRELAYEQARLKYFQGDAAGATKDFKGFLDGGGELAARARWSLVSIHIRQKDLEAADRLFLEGSLLNPAGPQGLGAYSDFVYQFRKDVDKALHYAVLSLAHGPNNLAYRTLASASYTKAALLYLSSNKAEADLWLARALQFEPDTEQALRHIDKARDDAPRIRAVILRNIAALKAPRA